MRHLFFIPTSLIWLLVWLGVPTMPARADSTDAPYLILYAFGQEGTLLSENTIVDTSLVVLGRNTLIGTLSGKSVVLMESGMGMTNAAMSTQAMIDRCRPRAVIFSGIAGAIDSSVHIGDIVVCSTWITHDYLYQGPKGPEPMPLVTYLSGFDSVTSIAAFDVDHQLLSLAKGLDTDVLTFETIRDRKPRVMGGGTGVSGNAFIDNKEKRAWLQENFRALVTDMETAAVAQVCAANGVPFIAFRSASDLAGGSGSTTAEEELDRFFQVAAANSALLVMAFVEAL